jgi:hypothetical protein
MKYLRIYSAIVREKTLKYSSIDIVYILASTSKYDIYGYYARVLLYYHMYNF